MRFHFSVPVMGFFMQVKQFVQLSVGMSPAEAGLVLMPRSVHDTLWLAVALASTAPLLHRSARALEDEPAAVR